MKKILHFFFKKKKKKTLWNFGDFEQRKKKKMGSIWGRDLKQSMEKINSFFTDFFLLRKLGRSSSYSIIRRE